MTINGSVTGRESIRPRARRILGGLAANAILALTLALPASAQTTRDPWLWPFAIDSIWNTPIGSSAVYAPINLGDAGFIGFDHEWFVRVTDTDPFRTVYYPGSWNNRDSGTTVSWLGSMRVPDSLYIPDATQTDTPNDCSTFLQPDLRTIIQLEPTTRTTVGGAIWGYPFTNGGESGEGDLYGQGERGTHYGSGLSAIGGSIRLGELTGTGPIRHALKVNLWGSSYLYYNPTTDSTPGYRWPARNADGAAASNYHGTNPQLEQGALLAIPPSVTAQSLGLETAIGSKLLDCLRDYGAYVVDDSGWNAYYLDGEKGVPEEVKAATGYDMHTSTNNSPLTRDINRLFKALSVITNNSPTSKGGGGTPRAPLAPPLGTVAPPPPSPPAAPTNLSATGGSYQVSLTWTASAGATGYKVYRSQNSSSGFVVVGTPSSTSFVNTGLARRTTYYYKVTAVNANGESGFSNQVSARTRNN